MCRIVFVTRRRVRLLPQTLTAREAVAYVPMKTFRVATWNLDGYRNNAPSRLPQQIELLQSLLADIVVLTEVQDTTRLPGMQFWWSDPGQPPYKPRDRAVGIASTWSGKALKVRDSRLSACVCLDAPLPLGRLIVYGTVIPYAMDGVRQKAALAWERHQKAVDDVVADLSDLRSDPDFVDSRIVVAGDFNTSLDGSNWYGHPGARSRLVEGLTDAGFQCHTRENIRLTRAADRAIVDHIWTTSDLLPVEPLHIWCDRSHPNRLSDHNGVALSLAVQE